MAKNISLSASIMCLNWLNAREEINELERNNIDYFHYDVIDGNFAPDFTMGSSIINSIINQTSTSSDYHLMVEEPSRLFETFQINPGDFFTIHQESSRNLHRNLVKIRQLGAKVGIALCPATPLNSLEYIIEELDLVIIMTVNPGFKGQELIPQSLNKIENLKNILIKNNLSTKISVDGNVNKDTIPEMVKAGADILVLGSSGLLNNKFTISESFQIIKNSIDLAIN